MVFGINILFYHEASVKNWDRLTEMIQSCQCIFIETFQTKSKRGNYAQGMI